MDTHPHAEMELLSSPATQPVANGTGPKSDPGGAADRRRRSNGEKNWRFAGPV